MLTLIRQFLRLLVVPISYLAGIVVIGYSILRNAEIGLLLLIALIPQPNLWYKYHQYPFGKDFIDILYFSIILGILINKRSGEYGRNTVLVLTYIVASYISLLYMSARFSLPLPISGANHFLFEWKNYAQMIGLYVLASKCSVDKKFTTKAILLIAVVVTLVGYRAYSSFSAGSSFDYLKRAGGPFEAVGLGANHLGAFLAHYVTFFGGIILYDKDRKRQVIYGLAIVCGMLALLYSYSRSSYLAVFVVLVYYGITRKRLLLIVSLLLVLGWKIVLPESVVDRITMTKQDDGSLEGSAAHRLPLWALAVSAFKANPFLGVGFGGFGLIVPEGELTDTHNFFVKTLSEQGIVGITLLLGILTSAFSSGFKLMRNGTTPIAKGIGFGFTGCLLAMLVTNMFGDRWSYFVLGGYFWVLWGLIDRLYIDSVLETSTN